MSEVLSRKSGYKAKDRLLLLCDGKPQLRHAPAAKKLQKQVIKSIKNVTRCRDSKTAKSTETR